MKTKKMLSITLMLAIFVSFSACDTQKRGRGKTPPGQEKRDDNGRDRRDDNRGRR